VAEAISRDRMQRAGLTLLSVDLPWMKEQIDTCAFNRVVLSLIRERGSLLKALQCSTLDTNDLDADVGVDAFVGTVFDTSDGANTLAAAHALMSVEESDVPEQACLRPAQVTVDSKVSEVPLSDNRAAPLAFAALVAGCKEVRVQGVTWGKRMTDAFVYGLPGSKVELLSLASGHISQEGVVVDIVESMEENSLIHTIDLSNNVVGLDGLHALQAAMIRCPRLVNLYLYNIGPWVDGDGLGCRRNADAEDVRLLQALRKTIKECGGMMQNEAFHEGDIEMSDDDAVDSSDEVAPSRPPVLGRAAFVKNNTLKGGRIMLRSRPVEGGRYANGWLADGQSVLVLKESSDGQWLNVQAASPAPVKGWIRSPSL